jgi:hypothetical protein
MAYPKTAKLDNPSGDYGTEAAVAPVAAAVKPLPSLNPQGGAPTLQRKSLRSNWQGTADVKQPGYSMPTRPAIPPKEVPTYLGDLQRQVKQVFDQRMKQMSEQDIVGSRFWRMYREMPDAAAAVFANRLWTNRLVAYGNVADWMKWNEGR